MAEQFATATSQAGEVKQLVVFSLGDEEFAIGIDEVREIIQAGAITHVPEAPDFVRGVSNVRGEIAAVIDLRKRFSLPEEKEAQNKYIIISEQEKNLFGLLVDELIEILRIGKEDIKEAPHVVREIHGEYIQGVIPREKRLIILLDLELVLSEKEMEELAKVHERHQEMAQRRQQRATAKAAEQAAPQPEQASPEEPEAPKTPASAKRKKKKE